MAALVALFVGIKLIIPVGADAASGWLSTASPTVQNISQLTPNRSPGFSNIDCVQQDYNFIDPNSGTVNNQSGCLVSTTQGMVGLSGSPVLYANTSQAVQINPDYPYTLQPIPNQGMMLSLTSAPTIGSYLHFYRDLRQHLTSNTNTLGQLSSYTVNSEPDFDLRDQNNAMLPTNALGTLSYSSNGSWMLVDTPGGSFIRVNMATFDVLPFAASLNRPGDYTDRSAETAISDDGHYAAIASNDFSYFRVYDLTTCAGNTNANYSQPLTCQFRDYWPVVAASLSGFKTIYRLRFINDDNISMTAVYNFHSESNGNTYDAAKFTVTAPGKQAHSLDYLALGDSYISGQGEFQYKDGTDTDTNECHLSPLAYPFTLGQDLYNQYNSIACSGAKTKDITGGNIQNYNVTPGGAQALGRADAQYDDAIYTNFDPGYRTQVSFVKRYQPRAITLSIGGNDIGFSDIVTKCVTMNIKHQTCYNSYDQRMKLIKTVDSVYTKLQQTYQQIMAADPGVHLYIIGYPQVVAHGSCGINVQLNDTDIDVAQDLVAYLDWTIQQAANSVGAQYVDTQSALNGHRLCESRASDIAMNGVTAGSDSGVFGLKVIGSESFHPNVLGHQLLAQAILSQTNNLRQAMPTADTNTIIPSPNDALAQMLLNGYPPSGNISPAIISVGGHLTNGSAYLGVGNRVIVDSSVGLRPNTVYQTSFDDSAYSGAGNVVTDESGNLNVSFVLPTGVSTGYHTFSVLGTNMAGQTVELDTNFYVAASPTDPDGDGVPNSQNTCYLLPLSGEDVDADGVDDACDPQIGVAQPAGYPAKVYLTGNTITATRP